MLDFAKDCERIGTYYSSSWLAALNNEVPGRRRAEYAERLRRLRAMVLLASAHDGIVYPTASQTLAFLPCDPVLGASLNDTFDGDGAAERGAAIDDGGTDVHAVGGRGGAGHRVGARDAAHGVTGGARAPEYRSARWARGSRCGAR